MMDENTALETFENNSSVIENMQDHLLELAEKADERINALKKIKKAALNITNKADWIDFGGKPYLWSPGCEKVARVFGLSWKLKGYDKTWEGEGLERHYIFTCTLVFKMRGIADITEFIGTCSTKDKFFGRAKGQQRPISEIDETNIMKKAYSNAEVNGVTRLLGLRNLTWDELPFKKEGMKSVTYAAGSQGGGLISEKQVGRLYSIAKANNVTQDQVKNYLGANYSLESAKDIKKSDYEAICNWAKEGK